ncbi:hypothetical protein J1605_003644 [Eschrichtius robustus]|uniref:Uncharacterized protein n=1 Tax=Eschrichtius robustus TaxID=9764 RepID=A0AB34HPK9_ESCRO|nr:hypothetical protein J1605_003644 [Eschrichtius robustus]
MSSSTGRGSGQRGLSGHHPQWGREGRWGEGSGADDTGTEEEQQGGGETTRPRSAPPQRGRIPETPAWPRGGRNPVTSDPSEGRTCHLRDQPRTGGDVPLITEQEGRTA